MPSSQVQNNANTSGLAATTPTGLRSPLRDTSFGSQFNNSHNNNATNSGSNTVSENGVNLQGNTFHGTVNLTTNTSPKQHREVILESLAYPSQYDRSDGIKDAFPDTYEWIFSKTPDLRLANDSLFLETGLAKEFKKQQGQNARFVQWLESPQNVFWIRGKAGSGKSTLMKFIEGHSKLDQHLKKWRGGKELVKVSHFFWRAGNEKEQQSVEGLLRALLHQILMERPDESFPKLMIQPNSRFRWNASRLSRSLEAVVKDSEHFFCFLIDGLDEFSGSDEEQNCMVEVIKKLASFSHVKICVSSRPEPFYQMTFGGYEKLTLQSLTCYDIFKTTIGRLRKIPKFDEWLARTKSKERVKAIEMIRDLCLRSEGVFLWLSIALDSLCVGIKNNDSLEDCRKRLLTFGNSTDELFSSMLGRIERRYHDHAVRLLFWVHRSILASPIFAFVFVDRDVANLFQQGTSVKVAQLAELDLDQLFRSFLRTIRARTGGLIEVTQTPKGLEMQLSSANPDTVPTPAHFRRARPQLPRFLGHLRFIHRNALEFANRDPHPICADQRSMARETPMERHQQVSYASRVLAILVVRCYKYAESIKSKLLILDKTPARQDTLRSVEEDIPKFELFAEACLSHLDKCLGLFDDNLRTRGSKSNIGIGDVWAALHASTASCVRILEETAELLQRSKELLAKVFSSGQNPKIRSALGAKTGLKTVFEYWAMWFQVLAKLPHTNISSSVIGARESAVNMILYLALVFDNCDPNKRLRDRYGGMLRDLVNNALDMHIPVRRFLGFFVETFSMTPDLNAFEGNRAIYPGDYNQDYMYMMWDILSMRRPSVKTVENAKAASEGKGKATTKENAKPVTKEKAKAATEKKAKMALVDPGRQLFAQCLIDIVDEKLDDAKTPFRLDQWFRTKPCFVFAQLVRYALSTQGMSFDRLEKILEDRGYGVAMQLTPHNVEGSRLKQWSALLRLEFYRQNPTARDESDDQMYQRIDKMPMRRRAPKPKAS